MNPLNRFFISIFQIAVGIGVLVLLFSVADRVDRFFLLPLAMWLAGGALIGSGIFNLFARPRLGALIGVIVQIALLVYVISQPHIVG